MPDLSHRPTRYATALITTGVLLAAGWPALDQRLQDASRLASTRAENADLRQQLEAVEQRQPATDAAAPRAEQIATTTPAVKVAKTLLFSPARPGMSDCAGYPDQETAQAAFSARPRSLKALDGDGDARACEQLKSRVRFDGEPTAPTSRVTGSRAARPLRYIPTKAQLVASGNHFGLAAGTNQEVDQLQYSLGRNATMAGFFKGWDTPFDAAQVRSYWQRGQVPVMTWESRPLADTEDRTDYSLSRITSGAFDGYLTAYAKKIKATGLPVVIRFDHEMNGNWYRWSEFESRYGVRVGDYVKAWRHVHDVFERNGANSFAVWLWSPNRIDNLSRFPAIDGYYPGHRYVDWVGMTAYFRPVDTVPTFASTFTKTLDAVRRVAPGKPVFLSEVGATEDGGNKAAWMKTLWPGVMAQPDVLGLMWFNYAISDAGHTNDWRLNSSPAAFDAFRAGLLASPFGRAFGLHPVFPPRSTSVVAAAPAPSPLVPTAAPGGVPAQTVSPTALVSPTVIPVVAPPSGKRGRGWRAARGSGTAVVAP